MRGKIISVGMAVVLLLTIVGGLSSVSAQTVTRDLPSGEQSAGATITVSLDVVVESATYYVIDEVVPTGWTVTSASDGGDYTSETDHVKWAVICGAADKTLTYTVTIPSDAAGDYTFTGTYGAEGVSETAILGDTTVTVDILEVSDTTPDANSHTAAVTTDINATFNLDIQSSSVSDATFVVHSGATGRLLSTEGIWSTAGATATLNSNTDFQPGEQVQVTATDSIRSTSGLNAVPYVWQFRTAAAPAPATFGPQQIISSEEDGALSVYSADLDGDGDMDVLSASINDNKVAWYENGNSWNKTVISGDLLYALNIYSADIDGDGDMDVLSASIEDGKIAWYENTDGSGSFGPQQIISYPGPNMIRTADLDGDGDMDVFSANEGIQTISWYENGNSWKGTTITSNVDDPESVYAADLDGDGDLDVLSTDDDIGLAWYENKDGYGNFGPQQIILNSYAEHVHSADIDGDGDMDVLLGSGGSINVSWFENTDGSGTFGTQQVISTAADVAHYVYAADLDGDSDLDVLSASYGDDKIAWYENMDGSGTFGIQQVISTAADGAYCVYAADLDGDSDLDVLSASRSDNKVAWYENTNLDFGDAPDPLVATAGRYPTLLSNDGPRHAIDNNICLGAAVDNDLDGQQSAGANGDDTDGTDDEDGVDPSQLVLAEGTNPSILVNLTNTTGIQATLTGWIDIDKDGQFEAAEKATTTLASSATSATLAFPVIPIGGGVSSTFARFRISTDAASVADPTGVAPDGEVEDYPVTINPVTVILTHPNGGEYVKGGGDYTILWNTNAYGVGTVTLRYSTDNGLSYPYTIVTGAFNSGRYTWTVPVLNMQTIKIKIEIHGSLLAEDASNSTFTIDSTPPDVTLTFPTGGEHWVPGGTYQIAWTASDNFKLKDLPISIQYSLDNWKSDALVIIARDEANDGIFGWTVPLGLTSNNFELKVRVEDAAGNVGCGHMDSPLIIQPLQTTLTVTYPNGGEILCGGSVEEIRWGGGTSSSVVALAYSLNGGNSYAHEIAADEANDGIYSWDIPGVDTRKLRIKIILKGAVTEEDESDGNVTVDNTPPVVNLSSPDGEETFEAGGVCPIHWEATDNVGLIESPVTLLYSENGGITYEDTIAVGEANDGEYVWTLPSDLNSEAVRVGVEVTDRVGLKSADWSAASLSVRPNELALIAPDGGEKLKGGTEYPVIWESGFKTGSVTLSYSTDGGASYPHVIAEGETNDNTYTWKVPEIDSRSVRVRVEVASVEIIKDESAGDFVIDSTPPTVRLLTLDGGEILESGGIYDIRWAAWDNFELIKNSVVITCQTGGSLMAVDTLSRNEPNDSTYAWQVPADLESDSVKIGVGVCDEVGQTSSDWSRNGFTVRRVVLTLIAPNGGEVYQGQSIQPVIWKSNFNEGSATLKFSVDGGVNYPYIIAEDLEPEGTFDWQVPRLNSETVMVKAIQTTQKITEDASDRVFTIEHLSPIVDLICPNGGEVWEAASVNLVRWSATDKVGLVANPISITYSTDGGKTFPNTLSTEEVNDSTLTWEIPNDLISDRLRVKVEATNTKGMKGYDISDYNVKIANPPPVVKGLSDTSFTNDRWLYFCLNPYVSDRNDSKKRLEWSSRVSEDKIEVLINQGNKWCTVIARGYTGHASIVLTATDPYGGSDSDTMEVEVLGSLTGIIVESTSIPDRFVLYQNYPNPFNPETTIRFGVPKRSEVVISVFNMKGEWIADLWRGEREPGTYQLRWNAIDNPSGIYAIKLETGNFCQIRKCILIK